MNVGDIVSCEVRYLPVAPAVVGKKLGVVVEVKGESIGVEFHDLQHGHDCAGHAQRPRGWYVSENLLELVEEYPHDFG